MEWKVQPEQVEEQEVDKVIHDDSSTMRMMSIGSWLGAVAGPVHLMEKVGEGKTSYRKECAVKERNEIAQMKNRVSEGNRRLRVIQMFERSSPDCVERKPA